jgi:hypothetical protein
MKKLLLLAGVALSNFVAIAQQNSAHSVVMTATAADAPIGKTIDFTKLKANRLNAQHSTANKGAAGGSRWYNYVDFLATIKGASVYNTANAGIFWDKADLRTFYLDQSGATIVDTIFLKSYGLSFDPSTTLLNNSAIYPGEIAINSNVPYHVDSVIVYGIYDRKATLTHKDTLRISLVYGTGSNTTTTGNMPINKETRPTITSSSATDTIFWASLFHDVNKNIVAKSGNGLAVVVLDKILDAASVNDTTADGFNQFKFAIPSNVMNVTANGIVGMGISFKYGGSYIPNDTLYDVNKNLKYSSYRGLWFEETAGQFPTYVKGEYNAGYLVTQPVVTAADSSWIGDYVPHYYFNSATFAKEFPYVDFKLSCTACNITGVADVKSTIESVFASPNPATDVMAISFNTIENATTKVAIMNMLGQEVDAKTISAVANTSNKVVFNVANLNAGIYLYSISSNGQTVSNRFVVAH